MDGSNNKTVGVVRLNKAHHKMFLAIITPFITLFAVLLALCVTLGFWTTLELLFSPWNISLLTITVSSICLTLFVIISYGIIVGRWRTNKLFKEWSQQENQVTVGFLHPYCSNGGGGERVLWNSIQALQKRYSFILCVIYTADPVDKKESVIDGVKKTFNIELPRPVEFIHLRSTGALNLKMWPLSTLLGQSIASMWVGMEAFSSFIPNVFFDTTGLAFNLILFKWLGRCKTACYVHYPTISTDMLKVVEDQTQAFNNAAWISNSIIMTKLKLLYYKIFSMLYSLVGNRSDVVMVNSSWTHGHIKAIWNPRRLSIVYPPCDTSAFMAPSSTSAAVDNQFRIVSVGQFRPEKRHEMQLQILHELLQHIRQKDQIKLVLIGSCRNEEDQKRLKLLQDTAKQLHISKYIEWKTKLSFNELKKELQRAAAGLHVMSNEHFGIGIVECMAAGCVMVAHNSGGPKMDIVKEWKGQLTGFLADSVDAYSDYLFTIYMMGHEDRQAITTAAQASVSHRFSVGSFHTNFLRATEALFNV